MDALIGAAGFLTVAAITPGPNNFVVMAAASRAGLLGALPAVAGIVSGSLVLLIFALAGVGAGLAAEPRLQWVITLAGCLYLSWLGAALFARTFNATPLLEPGRSVALPSGAIALFGFQFLNPKSWVMVLTATSALQAELGAVGAFSRLAVLFTVIPTLCLLLWSAFGSLMTHYLRREAVRRWFDRLMGCLLVASALLLLLETVP